MWIPHRCRSPSSHLRASHGGISVGTGRCLWRLSQADSRQMRTVQEILAEVGLPSSLTRRGDYTIVCPRCSSKRKKSDATCLSVKVDHKGVVWNCFHCQWQGGAQYRSKADDDIVADPNP